MFGNETKVSVPVAPTPFRMLPTIGTGPDPWQCPKGRGLTAFVLEAQTHRCDSACRASRVRLD